MALHVHGTWWMMPEPGFQNPMPYLAPAEARKSYTSLFCFTACFKSATPPNLPSLPAPTNHLTMSRVLLAGFCSYLSVNLLLSALSAPDSMSNTPFSSAGHLYYSLTASFVTTSQPTL